MIFNIKKYLIVSSAIYFGSLLLGCLLYITVPFNLGKIKVVNQTAWFEYVMHNGSLNLVLIFGFLTFCVVSVVLLLFNGVIIGYMVAHAAKYGMFLKFFFLLAPHGIAEIPAMLLASSISFTTLSYLRKQLRQRQKISFKYLSLNVFKYSVIVAILTLIAGIIESNVTINISS
ncbi:stage II sporulation protein M [Laceyella putida]|uniref:Stage II sporulation protein M n=1 Tax=Laceyella putida TaxID=110101 RepID=A0ABW2RF66_9BACL